jgi:hypothetical protein
MVGYFPLLFAALSLLTACALTPASLQMTQAPDLRVRQIKRIAILPPTQEGREKEPTRTLAARLYNEMAVLPRWQIISEREMKEASGSVSETTLPAQVRRFGELVFADAVATVRLVRYRERVGEDWGVQSPASVAFVIDLWDAKRGDVIYSARFDETQQALTENLFALAEFRERGLKWLRAEEMIEAGVKKAVQQLHAALYS